MYLASIYMSSTIKTASLAEGLINQTRNQVQMRIRPMPEVFQLSKDASLLSGLLYRINCPLFAGIASELPEQNFSRLVTSAMMGCGYRKEQRCRLTMIG